MKLTSGFSSINVKNKDRSFGWVFLEDEEIALDQDCFSFEEFFAFADEVKKIVDGGYQLVDTHENIIVPEED